MKKLLYFFLPLLAFVACTEDGVDDNNNPQPQPEAKIPISISTSITRATDSEFEIDDKIGLYVVNQPNALAASGNHVDNVCFTYSGEWTPDEEIYWQDQTTKADFYAYYPYSATVNTSAHSFSVKADQSEEEDYWASDFLWGQATGVAPTAAAVPITVNHLLSNMHIYLKAGNGFTEESLATANISVKINNVKTAASIDLSSGVATAEGEATTITPWNTGEYYRAMVVPQTIAKGDALITITIDEEEYVFAPGLTLLANKQHKIVLTIDKTAGGINVSIGNWDVVEENFDDSPEILVTAACSEEALKSCVYEVFQDAIESFTNEDGVYIIRLKEGCTTIPDYAFGYSDLGLTSVTIGNGITSIGVSAFEYCTSLTSITIPNSVTLIGDDAFCACHSLTSVTIPDSVTDIGDRAFAWCDLLASVTIGNNVTEIGSMAFAHCESLTAFYGKFATKDNRCLIVNGVLNSVAPEGIKEYAIPDNVTSIGDGAFSQCSSLRVVTIPESVTSIGEAAFSDCTSLFDIDIPDSVTSIGEHAFYYCDSLTDIYIPDSVTSIGEGVFCNCTSLSSVIIGNSVTEIGDNVFRDCPLISYITIPDSVTSIGDYAFLRCYSLKSITIPDSVTSIGHNAFSDCTSLTSTTIGNSVTEIGWEAFDMCTSLTSVTIGNSVTYIGSKVFAFCKSLTSITIPNSVTSIEYNAFYECNSLKELYCKPTTPPTLGEYGLRLGDENPKIYVPRNSIAAYKSAYGWKDYADDIVGYDFE